jgi:hypothetical protein
VAPALVPTENPEAYDFDLCAEQLTHRAEPASAADALHAKAIALDPVFADAYGDFAAVSPTKRP